MTGADNKLEELENKIIECADNAFYPDEDGSPKLDWDEYIINVKALLTERERLSRIDETKLYEDWFNNDSTTHIEDFIEDRLAHLSNPERGEKPSEGSKGLGLNRHILSSPDAPFGERCEVKDLDEFPELTDDDNRCLNCVAWEWRDAEIRKTLERLEEQAEPKLGDFDITHEEYSGAVKAIHWYKSAIDNEIKELEER